MTPRQFYDLVPRDTGLLNVVSTGSCRLALTFIDCVWAKKFMKELPSSLKALDIHFKLDANLNQQHETIQVRRSCCLLVVSSRVLSGRS